MDLEIAGQGYIVVGGSKGMGFDVAKQLAANGGNVVIISRGGAEDAANTLAAEHGVLAFSICGDATSTESVNQAIGQAVDALGGVRGLVTANAERRYGGLLDATDDDWAACVRELGYGNSSALPCGSAPHDRGRGRFHRYAGGLFRTLA